MTKAQYLGLVFAIATALFWGLYGPALGKARTPGESPFKPYIFIGLAYLIWGMIGGIVAVKASGGNFHFTRSAVVWGFVAGSLGAFGALTLTKAMFEAKDASLVMPVVFGGATMVSAIVGILIQFQKGQAHVPPLQILGFLLVIVGVILVQRFAAHGPAPAAPSPAAESHAAGEPGETPPSKHS